MLGGSSSHRPRRWRISSASSTVEVSWTLGSVIASRTSPATSETVRLTRRAGATRAARRPPLIAETCLRTAFTSTIGAPEPRRSSWRRRFSAWVTPSGGRLVSAELPPVNTAIARSPGPRSSTRSMTRRAAASERSVGRGWSASSTSTRSSAIESAPSRTATAPPSSRSPRIPSSVDAIASVALPEPTTITRASGFEGVLAALERDPAVGQLDGLRGREADVASLEACGGNPQRKSAHVRHPGGGQLRRVRDHAAIAAGNTSPG